MKNPRRLAPLALAVLVASTLLPRPAFADGAASTRNIIFGAAAAGGTLLILNHNKKVHQKYAEYDQRQAATQAQRNQAEAAYESERQAYDHEAALVSEYRTQTAYQHKQVIARDREIAMLERSLRVAKYGAPRAARTAAVPARPAARPVVASHAHAASAPPVVSYGWGSY